MDEQLRRQYLDAMGIQNWVPRDAGDPSETASEPEQAAATQAAPDPVPAPEADIPAWLDEVPPADEEWTPAVQPEPAPFMSGPDDITTLDWDGLASRVVQCTACALHKGRRQTVFGVGDRAADLMVIGEAPGAEEDRQGEPFVGRAGQLLNAMLGAIGLQRGQVYIANILKCRPPENRDPRAEEALCCEPFLQRQVALVRPRVILAAGRIAAQNLLKSQDAVGRMRNREYRFEGIPVVVTYHPAYLLRSPTQKGKAWLDLQRLLPLLKEAG